MNEPTRGRIWMAPWLVLGLAISDWFALRTGTVSHPLWVLGVLVGAVAALLLLRLGVVLRHLTRSSTGHRVSRFAELALLLGVLVALVAGMANWLFGLQGFAILAEGESVPLLGGSRLQEFRAGPLARLEELGLILRLDEVELVAEPDGQFYPRSRLQFLRPDSDPIALEVMPGVSASDGTLRFFQGSFGFAPRIVIVRDSETLFDRVVPFLTERSGRGGIAFEGRFTVESEGLDVFGTVDLRSLDEAMRGHATLSLTVSRSGETLGQGDLLPGHFARVGEDLRIGFVDLQRWSEIDIMRRSYGTVVLAGGAVALLALPVLGVARWRGW